MNNTKETLESDCVTAEQQGRALEILDSVHRGEIYHPAQMWDASYGFMYYQSGSSMRTFTCVLIDIKTDNIKIANY